MANYKSTISGVTKEYILSYTSEIAIFEYYLGVEVRLNVDILSPTILRSDDKSPGCIFWYNGDKVKFIDRARGINEDCFGIVQIIYGGNYNDTLNRIASDFKLDGRNRITPPTKNSTDLIPLGAKRKVGTTFQYQVQNFTEVDKEYWLAKDIHSPSLEKFKVRSVSAVFINGNTYYIWDYRDPGYVYEFYDGTIQFYFPFRKKDKFRTNSKIVLGWDYLPEKGEKVIITKSYKDIILLTELYDIPSVAPIGEGTYIPERYIKSLFKRFDNVYILYDNDEAGEVASAKNVELYPELIPIFFDKDMGKDTDEVTLNLGPSETQEILNYLT